MADVLTERRERILAFVRDYSRARGYAPSWAEIAAGCGFANSRSVQQHLAVLREAGYVTWQARRARSLRLLTPRHLRVWCAGVPVGINHAQTGTGRARHKTDAAVSWGQRVEHALTEAAVRAHLHGRAVWADAALGVRLHFYVTAKPVHSRLTGEATLRKLDVDAPIKQTLDDVMRGLGIGDDATVRWLEVAQTVLDADLPRVGGYGRTRQGAWIEVWALSPAELARLAAETPGEPA